MRTVKLLAIFIISVCQFNANAQSTSKEMAALISDQFSFASNQYKVLNKHVPADSMPKTYNAKTGRVESSNTKWWCSGFFPGSLLYIYEHTNDKAVLEIAKQRLSILEKEKHYTGNHDLGFMMYCSFGNAYRLFKNEEDHRTIDTAAASLSTRFRPEIASIQSWNKNKNFNCPVIIDNMMNLELLHWVSDNGGDKKFKEIALTHANTTIKNHYRPNYSAYHVIDYDLETKQVIAKKNHQGNADSSSWSRGQSWGLYGFTMMYRFAKDKRYLDQAKNIAAFLLNHPNMPSDKIPYWDYDAPGIPNALRDASAASIMASALLELAQYTKGSEKKNYIETARLIIVKLASDEYRAKLGDNGGFLIKHGVGHLLGNSEIDVPLTYGDYYFLEAMHRYKEWVL